jgi:hypothetical protein
MRENRCIGLYRTSPARSCASVRTITTPRRGQTLLPMRTFTATTNPRACINRARFLSVSKSPLREFVASGGSPALGLIRDLEAGEHLEAGRLHLAGKTTGLQRGATSLADRGGA